jgi:hypothetical protein
VQQSIDVKIFVPVAPRIADYFDTGAWLNFLLISGMPMPDLNGVRSAT